MDMWPLTINHEKGKRRGTTEFIHVSHRHSKMRNVNRIDVYVSLVRKERLGLSLSNGGSTFSVWR